MKDTTKLNLLVIFILACACSGQVIRRGNPGNRYGGMKNSDQFSPVKKKVALLQIVNEAPYGGDDLSVTATEELRRELSRTPHYVIDSAAANIFGDSKEIYAGGGMKLVQLTRKAKMAGINFVLFGRIKDARVRQKADEIGLVRQTKSYAEGQVELRIFDVNNAKEIYIDTLDGVAEDNAYRFYLSDDEANLSYRQELLRYAVRVAVRKSIPKIADLGAKLDWTGRVAKVLGSRIYINAGRESGINMGDILKVMTEGTEIFDPETGAHIGTSKGEVKGTLEIVDYFGPDGAVAILHSGGSVIEGDYVQLY